MIKFSSAPLSPGGHGKIGYISYATNKKNCILSLPNIDESCSHCSNIAHRTGSSIFVVLPRSFADMPRREVAEWFWRVGRRRGDTIQRRSHYEITDTMLNPIYDRVNLENKLRGRLSILDWFQNLVKDFAPIDSLKEHKLLMIESVKSFGDWGYWNKYIVQIWLSMKIFMLFIIIQFEILIWTVFDVIVKKKCFFTSILLCNGLPSWFL